MNKNNHQKTNPERNSITELLPAFAEGGKDPRRRVRAGAGDSAADPAADPAAPSLALAPGTGSGCHRLTGTATAATAPERTLPNATAQLFPQFKRVLLYRVKLHICFNMVKLFCKFFQGFGTLNTRAKSM